MSVAYMGPRRLAGWSSTRASGYIQTAIMAEGHVDPELRADIVVDTNVLLDLYSCHDLVKVYEEVGVEGVGGDRATWRRQRARDAIMLAILFNKRRYSVFHLNHEFLDLVTRRVPISDTGAFENHYASILHRLLRRALPNWRQVSDDLHPRLVERGLADEAGKGARGDAADLRLLDFAKTSGVPLISNEGFSPQGVNDKHGLRGRATEAGIPVFTPREFFGGQLDEDAESRVFLKRMRVGVRGFMEGQPRPDIAFKSVDAVFALLRHVLYGVTRGQQSLPVLLPPPGGAGR